MLFKKDRTAEDHYLDQAIRGEREGLEYLVDAYKEMAYTIAVRIVSNSQDAEEVVQDSFLKAFKYLHQFKRASKFSTWLYRIIYTTALTKIGSRKPITYEMDEDEDYIDYVSNNEDGLERLADADRKRFLSMAMKRLNQDDQLIISLHYIAEKSIAEITEILDMKSSAVKMRLLRSREKLERQLKRLLNSEIYEL